MRQVIELDEKLERLLQEFLRNPALSPNMVFAVGEMSTDTATLWDDVLRHPNVPKALFDRWSNSANEALRVTVAKSRTTPASTLRMLSCDPAEEVRTKVASNPNTPEDTLVILSLDDSRKVQSAVVYNGSASKATHLYLERKLGFKSTRSRKRSIELEIAKESLRKNSKSIKTKANNLKL